MIKYKIKYEKFRGSIWVEGVCIKGFNCFHSEHAWKLAQKYLKEKL